MRPTTPTRPAAWLALLLAAPLAASCGGGGSSPPPPPPTAFKLHYHRALVDYAGWQVVPTAGAAAGPFDPSASDGFGAVYTFDLSAGATSLAFSLAKGGTTDAAGALTVDVSGTTREAWVFSGWQEAITRRLPVLPTGPDDVVLYYGGRADADYTGWGLHLWGDQVKNTTWSGALGWIGVDPGFGAGFDVGAPPVPAPPVGNCVAGSICVIAHKGDTKDPGPDMSFSRAVLGNIVFLTSGSSTLTAVPVRPGTVSISGAGAHLLTAGVLAWNVTDPAAVAFELRHSPTAGIAVVSGEVTGGTVLPVTRNGTVATNGIAKWKHLQAWPAFTLDAAGQAAVPAALKGQLVAVARDAAGKALQATLVQTYGAIDELFATAAPLGPTFATVAGAPTLSLWAPTAQAVTLHVHDVDAARTEVAGSPVVLTEGAGGVWSATGPAGWYGKYYRYELRVYHPSTDRIETVVVTDPWATNLDVNSHFAQAVDLRDPALAPAGWDALVKPPLEAPEDIVVYEGHVRDFSARDATAPAAVRGKFLGLAPEGAPTDGQARLRALAQAGLTHLHLLPAFDLATVDEDPSHRVDLDDLFATLCAKVPEVPVALCGAHAGQTIAEAMASYPGDSDQQQAIAGSMHLVDSFNWGYDPLHYGVPEGSYASTAEGTARIVEFRRMVLGLAGLGLRTVMDVVYNHTNAAGLADTSVLDKVVPGYYHRRNPETGFVETSSCCANTATEHAMMGRLMNDTLVRWARDYKVDGFRFDLMGLHLKDDVLAARDALQALTPAADGVDGSTIYLYGEGWNMGELKDSAQGTNAEQLKMGGTGIGTFNDRIRDAVRGGSAFDAGSDLRKRAGFANGLWLDPNELAPAGATAQADWDQLAEYTNWIKIGLAGGLSRFRLQRTESGAVVTANSVGYNGARAAYTLDPQESINYVSAHDNQVLWDLMQYRLPTGTPAADRARAQLVALSLPALGQGVPFFHMGDDLLRSKSMERDSYDSGDWFNRIDWSGQSNGWRSGLPNAGKDQGNWSVILPIFADASATPAPADIAAAAGAFEDLLRLRKSSRLFRLRTEAEVLQRLDFRNVGATHVPGVIVMTLADGTDASCVPALADLDPAVDAIVVIFNADKQAHAMDVAGAAGFVLHPVQVAGSDPVVKGATVEAIAGGQRFTVPARTTAVFVAPQAGAPGAGLPCNTH